MKKSKIIVLIVFVIIIVAILIVTLSAKQENKKPIEINPAESQETNVSIYEGIDETYITEPVGSQETDVSVYEGIDETHITEPVGSQETDVSVYYDGDTCIQTQYITLHMPEQWSDCLHVVQREIDNSLEYDFYCSIPGKKEVKLFVINFSKTGAYYYGKITTEKGEEIHISLTAADLLFDDDWSTEEVDEVCAMQEASNYLVEQLRKEQTFTEN